MTPIIENIILERKDGAWTCAQLELEGYVEDSALVALLNGLGQDGWRLMTALFVMPYGGMLFLSRVTLPEPAPVATGMKVKLGLGDTE